jgi:hypothetical protein
MSVVVQRIWRLLWSCCQYIVCLTQFPSIATTHSQCGHYTILLCSKICSPFLFFSKWADKGCRNYNRHQTKSSWVPGGQGYIWGELDENQLGGESEVHRKMLGKQTRGVGMWMVRPKACHTARGVLCPYDALQLMLLSMLKLIRHIKTVCSEQPHLRNCTPVRTADWEYVQRH